MAIQCDKTNCQYNYSYYSHSICRRRQGYDSPGGDIKIRKSGYCDSYKKKDVTDGH